MNVEKERIAFYFSFVFDGVNTYNEENFAINLPEYSQLEVIADPPAMEQWDEVMKVNAGGTLNVYAQKVTLLSKNNIFIYYNSSECILHSDRWGRNSFRPNIMIYMFSITDQRYLNCATPVFIGI